MERADERVRSSASRSFFSHVPGGGPDTRTAAVTRIEEAWNLVHVRTGRVTPIVPRGVPEVGARLDLQALAVSVRRQHPLPSGWPARRSAQRLHSHGDQEHEQDPHAFETDPRHAATLAHEMRRIAAVLS